MVTPTAFIKSYEIPTYSGFTTGATIYYNFQNTSCYPGSGSLIYDLSGNANTGSMTGSVAFNSGSINNMEMQGGGASTKILVNNYNLSNTNSYTFGGWFYGFWTGGFAMPAYCVVSNVVTADTNIWGGYAFLTGSIRISTNFNISNRTAQTSEDLSKWYANRWTHLMFQNLAQSGSVSGRGRLYVNGDLAAIVGGPYATSSINNNKFSIGCGNNVFVANMNFNSGSFATFEAYDRFLSSDEIYGNYNVSKSFFGF